MSMIYDVHWKSYTSTIGIYSYTGYLKIIYHDHHNVILRLWIGIDLQKSNYKIKLCLVIQSQIFVLIASYCTHHGDQSLKGTIDRNSTLFVMRLHFAVTCRNSTCYRTYIRQMHLYISYIFLSFSLSFLLVIYILYFGQFSIQYYALTLGNKNYI